ncbi:phosphate acetyltransferase [Streptococcus cuniculi]|uniref:Phosphate acetyltransferase n=1 Tax=Streptococcus cuniculi TaxID=1432788 RepID=A0A4Y9JDU8_9STRE|nr:phosphate acetyltransferase [Streptococcus cuniculi]MBF0777535.1 phosphate acetyltransferase [Streptococcus cuniculi]TFU98711.1 phosphate acetyltransferase [Streptococcus cuniculi]
MGIRSLFGGLREKIVGQQVKIVFPEGNDERVVRAAARLKFEGLLDPIILGDPDDVRGLLSEFGFADPHCTIINPNEYADFEAMKEAFVEVRKGKATMEDADKLLRDVNYFGVMLVKMGLADGMVSGAIHSTADTVRPALQIIKTKPGISRTSGVFLMNRENTNERYVFADCAINIDPNAQELAEIAVNTAETASIFDIEPKVAMLSFSTKGSGKAPQVDKVAEATRIAKELAPDLALDGELQFDAAFVPETAAIKAPDSDVAGQANVFVFPDLQAGNIGYKIAQRLGMFDAIGPILQGLNMPVNDLSRGSSADDIYKLAIITAAQALENEK